MAAQVGADYHGRFIIQLLQNASDQAAEAGLRNSWVTLFRTDEFVALANAGLPFTLKGLRSITSLGLRTKNPQDAIGNKGIGFKSVFQVSESPEIYSSCSVTESFADAQGLMFKLSLSPFVDPRFDNILRSMVTEQWKDLGRVDESFTIERMVSEIKAAAPFKFPLPLSETDLKSRIAELGELPTGQTLVVLPLRKEPETAETVEQAIDDLFADGGATILFLPSVSTIRVFDSTRRLARTISRRTPDSEHRVERHGQLSTVTTSVSENGVVDEQSWRLIERRMGTPDVVSPAEAARKGPS